MAKYEKERECLNCGKEFVSEHPQRRYCCEECRANAEKLRQEQRTKHYKTTEKEKASNMPSISHIAKMAKDAGMSYGKYVEKMKGA